MGLEYSFTLTVPLADLDKAMEILARAKQKNPAMRQSRKTDRHDCARIYLSFPFSPCHNFFLLKKTDSLSLSHMVEP
ncbi:MAG: hypothetical protein JRJ68_10555 [Deltaproteobacteria bacterium]|nr:hypothetical protein [Deltaproteobacteria bacterium]